jgi:fused signal recognition particle receptor
MTSLYIAIAVAVAVVALSALIVGSRRRRGPGREPRLPKGTTPVPSTEQSVAPVPSVGPGPPVEAGSEGAPGPRTDSAVAVEPERPGAPPSFRDRLGKARGLFSGAVGSARSRGAIDATFEELEEALLRADVGVATTQALLGDLRQRVKAKEVAGGEQLIEALRADLVDLLEVVADSGAAASDGRGLRFDGQSGVTNVWLFVGVNGVGKTTTVGKLARQQAAAGHSVLLAAGDTFRAAAGEQLALWAERAGAEVVRGAEGGDPSAVVFDAVQRAAARGNDLVLADTAGRLHTKVNLVEELKKIRRIADRPPGRVTEVLLVLDATTGQNGLVQAREFTDAVGVTGVVLTKLDGTAKGGVVIAVQRELRLPVKLVGLGEGPDDLVPFDPSAFVDALLG